MGLGGHRRSWVLEEEFLGWFGQSFERKRHEIVFVTLKNIFIICRSYLVISSR